MTELTVNRTQCHQEESLTQWQNLVFRYGPKNKIIDYVYFGLYKNDEYLVRTALLFNPNLNAMPEINMPSLLWIAVHRSTVEIMELLIKAGANIFEEQTPRNFYASHSIYNYDCDYRSFSNHAGYTYDTRITLLHWAIMMGDPKKVKVLLKYGANPNSRDHRANSVLLYAIESQNIEIVKLLLRSGAQVNYRRSRFPNNIVLYDALYSGNTEIVKLLLEHGADLRMQNYKGLTPIHTVASAAVEDVSMAKVLINYTRSLDDRSRKFFTPLHYAIKNRNQNIVRLLLDHGADPNIPTNSGESPLLLAVKTGSPTLTEILCSRNANVNYQTLSGRTALEIACYFDLKKIVMILLKYNAQVNIHNEDGSYIIHTAIKSRDIEIIGRILDRCSHVDLRDGSGNTPLHLAAELGNEDIVELLLKRGANPHALNEHQENVLHFASKAELENIDIVQLLLKIGVSVNEANNWGITPLHYACFKGRDYMARLYINYGADVNSKTTRLEYPLHLSVEKSSASLVEFLLQHGARVNQDGAYGETAIYIACKYELIEKIRILLKYGADISVTDHSGFTPFHWIPYKNVFSGRCLMKHMAKLVYTNQKVHENDIITINSKKQLRRFFNDCLFEISQLHSIKFFRDISLFDVLMKKQKELVNLLRNIKCIQKFKETTNDKSFILYGHDLRFKFHEAEKKRNTLQAAEDIINSGFCNLLPDPCVDLISNYLTVIDPRFHQMR